MCASHGPGPYEIKPLRIADMPSRLRPREQLDRDGPEKVPDDVLLAIVLRSGVRGRNVVELARQLLQEYGSLAALSQASVEELSRVHGMGKVKAQVLKSVLELARRVAAEGASDRPLVRVPEDAVRVLKGYAQGREEESFWVLLLDSRYRLRKAPIEVTKGLLDSSLVHPREVFKEAIRCSSAAIVLAHNHPSGDPTPSAEDIRITRQIVEAGRIVDIPVLDHVVLGREGGSDGNSFISLREMGIVEFSS